MRPSKSQVRNCAAEKVVRISKFYGIGLPVLIILVLVSACGGSDTQQQAPRSTDNPAITGPPASFNADDIAFAQSMVTLCRQTAELAALVPTRSNDSRLVALAADIDTAQRSDLEIVKVFLVQWNENPNTATSQGGQGNTVGGVVDDAMLTRLKSTSGAEFGVLWLQSMIKHQQAVAEAAQAEIAHGSNIDAVATAKKLVGTSQAGIGQMQRALANG